MYKPGEVMMGEPKETAELSSWVFMDTGTTVREPVWDRPKPSIRV